MTRKAAFLSLIFSFLFTAVILFPISASAALNILPDNLPSGYVGVPFSFKIDTESGVPFADGGDADSLPDYEWCVTDPLPFDLSYECNGTLLISAACGLDTGTWQRCTSLKISGIPLISGSSGIPVYVRDNDSNISEKAFDLNIYSWGIEVCDQYSVGIIAVQQRISILTTRVLIMSLMAMK